MYLKLLNVDNSYFILVELSASTIADLNQIGCCYQLGEKLTLRILAFFTYR